VHNGIRSAEVDPVEVERARCGLGAADGDLLIGIVGQIAWWKGQDVFIEAAAKLAADASLGPLRFAVVGDCLYPANEGAFDAAIRRRTAEVKLDHQLTFAGSIEPIEPVMAALDVCVHASRLPEPFGRVLVEAMAQGTPVVSTTIGAGPELVLPGAGVLVQPGDADALAGALVEILADGRALAGRAASARAAAARFDIAATVEGVLDVYAELLSR
jgi:glycosyltransferase involved in cell wall biosynthesis